jgi:serine/threonine protein phosphatase PrpC
MTTFYCRNHADAKSDGPFGALAIVDATAVFLGVVGDAMGSAGPGAAARLIAEVAATVKPNRVMIREWPDRLASSVAERVAASIEGDPGCVIFCAVAASDEVVQVCTAGDIRVHLVKDGKMLHCTQDHILENESRDWVREKYGDISMSDHATLLTRTIGMCSLPPGRETWSIAAPFIVLICSCEYHRHRSPNTYMQDLLDIAKERPDAPNDGFLARIDL